MNGQYDLQRFIHRAKYILKIIICKADLPLCRHRILQILDFIEESLSGQPA